jgi:polyphosphate glucokinase
MDILGIDVGGSGIKAAIVDTISGELRSERRRVDTPKPSTPKAITKTIAALVDSFEYEGPVGCCFPTVVVNGVTRTAGNIDKAWRGTQADLMFSNATGLPFALINDADAAGLAEMRLGAGRALEGMVITITIGTGLGSGVFLDGMLVPNIEAGRMPGKDGDPIEFYAGDRARKKADLSWKKWGKRFNWFLARTARVFAPDHFILGGGASKKYDRYRDCIDVQVPIHVARFRNNAGIIGAALAARTDNLP